MRCVIGVLTGGGDCPGLNAVDPRRRRAGHATHGIEVVGIRNGWEGLLDGDVRAARPDAVRGIL